MHFEIASDLLNLVMEGDRRHKEYHSCQGDEVVGIFQCF